MSYTCFAASVNLTLLSQNSARPDIDCPGDTISYNCSIESNTTNLHLTWNIILPDLSSESITYDNDSVVNNLDSLPLSINTLLSKYVSGQYIESIIFFMVIRNGTLNGTKFQCSIQDLDEMSGVLTSTATSKTTSKHTMQINLTVVNPHISVLNGYVTK